MGFLIPGKAWIMAGAVVAVVALLGAVYWQGVASERTKAKLKRQIEQSDTLKRINDALSQPLDLDAIDNSLRDLSE
ncbi:MAG: hypothetical protein ACPG61_15600 [Paracoccaceae bacterium]